MRWPLLILSFATAFIGADALAQPLDAVRGVRIVVPPARGRKQHGGPRLTRGLRRTLSDGLGPLISSRALWRAQRSLRIPKKQRWTRRALGRAGQEVGADYVLYTTITRKGWLYTARARLVNTATLEVQMDFRSQFYDPAKDAENRGRRIGRRTLLKMQTLAEEGRLLATGPVISPSSPVAEPSPASPSTRVPIVDDPAPSAPPAARTPAPDTGPLPPSPIDPVATTDPAVTAADPATAIDAKGPPPPPSNEPISLLLVDPEPTRVARAPSPPPPPRPRAAAVRLSVTGGAGLLRRYDVSSDAVDDSGLSFPLDPTSLVQTNVELLIPTVGLGAEIDGALRLIRYEVGTLGEDPERPFGFIVNGAFWATYHFELAGSGRGALRLIPKIGARLDVASVDEHAANFVISTTALSVAGGLGLRWPVSRTLEIVLAVDGGWVALYEERPTTSGDAQLGFTVGGELDVRIWLTSAFGIAIDSQFRYMRVDFDGAPTRSVPVAEQEQLQDVTVSTQDVLTSMGLALRF